MFTTTRHEVNGPTLDLNVIQTLREQYAAIGNPNGLAERVTVFLERAQARFQQLQRLTIIKNAEEEMDILNALRTDSDALGACAIRDASAQLLVLLQAGDRMRAQFALRMLGEQLEKTSFLLVRAAQDQADSVAIPRILIIDDEPELVELIADYFETRGWRASRAGCASDALELLAHEKVNAVLSDVRMPGMALDDFAPLLRQTISSNAPIVLMTGFIPPALHEVARLGVNAILEKPFRMEQLWQSVLQYARAAGLPSAMSAAIAE